MLGALGYLLISGAAFATVRSYIMISIMFLAVLLDRPALALRNVALAALLILVLWPESLFDAGFQMSFAAVVALVSAYEWLRVRDEARGACAAPRRARQRRCCSSAASSPRRWWRASRWRRSASTIFTTRSSSRSSPTCWRSRPATCIVMPAALAALVAMPFGLEAAPLWLMGLGIEAMVWCANAVARLPGAVGRVPAIPTYAFALMVAGGLWWALWSTRWRVLGVVPIALGLMLAPDGASSRRADRARRRAGGRARRRRQAVGARRPRLHLRAGALAGA